MQLADQSQFTSDPSKKLQQREISQKKSAIFRCSNDIGGNGGCGGGGGETTDPVGGWGMGRDNAQFGSRETS